MSNYYSDGYATVPESWGPSACADIEWVFSESWEDEGWPEDKLYLQQVVSYWEDEYANLCLPTQCHGNNLYISDDQNFCAECVGDIIAKVAQHYNVPYEAAAEVQAAFYGGSEVGGITFKVWRAGCSTPPSQYSRNNYSRLLYSSIMNYNELPEDVRKLVCDGMFQSDLNYMYTSLEPAERDNLRAKAEFLPEKLKTMISRL